MLTTISANFYLMASLGDLVRVARIDKGWSQRELVRRIGKSATYVHYLEGLNLQDAPFKVKADLIGQSKRCGKCDAITTIQGQVMAFATTQNSYKPTEYQHT